MRFVFLRDGLPVVEVSAPNRAKDMRGKVSGTLISIVATAIIWDGMDGRDPDLTGCSWEIDEEARQWVEKAFPSFEGSGGKTTLFGVPVRWVGGNIA